MALVHIGEAHYDTIDNYIDPYVFTFFRSITLMSVMYLFGFTIFAAYSAAVAHDACSFCGPWCTVFTVVWRAASVENARNIEILLMRLASHLTLVLLRQFIVPNRLD